MLRKKANPAKERAGTTCKPGTKQSPGTDPGNDALQAFRKLHRCNQQRNRPRIRPPAKIERENMEYYKIYNTENKTDEKLSLSELQEELASIALDQVSEITKDSVDAAYILYCEFMDCVESVDGLQIGKFIYISLEENESFTKRILKIEKNNRWKDVKIKLLQNKKKPDTSNLFLLQKTYFETLKQ